MAVAYMVVIYYHVIADENSRQAETPGGIENDKAQLGYINQSDVDGYAAVHGKRAGGQRTRKRKLRGILGKRVARRGSPENRIVAGKNTREELKMYKFTFGNRGVEFASHANETVVAGLWGHPGAQAVASGHDKNGNEIYLLTDLQNNIVELPVTCEWSE